MVWKWFASVCDSKRGQPNDGTNNKANLTNEIYKNAIRFSF